jgi:hypothetical protein
MHALQIQNVKRNVVKKASINELNQTQIQEQPEIKLVQENKQTVEEPQIDIKSLGDGTSIDNLPSPVTSDNIGSEI